MGRSKAAGKPVEEPSLDDLRRERVRCQVLSEIYPERSAKGLRKRLIAIERRMRELGLSDEQLRRRDDTTDN